MSETTKFDEWALVELFGHQKIGGKVSEASLAGGAFLRVDVPETKSQRAYTRFFGPGAIYSINPCEETIVRTWCEHHSLEPVHRYELPQIAEKVNDPAVLDSDPQDL